MDEAKPSGPVIGISRDRIYPRCVWCGGENYALAVLAYSAGAAPCAAVAACGRFLPMEYRAGDADSTTGDGDGCI